MSSSPLNVALLGAGIFANQAHLPALSHLGPSYSTLRAIYSRSTASASQLADTAKDLLGLHSPPDVYSDDNTQSDRSLSALLARKDIDAVIVVLPISLQPSIVLQSLAAGKHVLSEKPVAKDVASALALINEYEVNYKPKGLIWRVAENYEAEPGYRAAAKAIADGKIGDVRFFRLTAVGYVGTDSKWYKTPWRTVPDYQGGFLLDGGVHSAALLRLLIASNPSTSTPAARSLSQLSSHASLSRPHLLPHDTITAVLSTEPISSAPSAQSDGSTPASGTALPDPTSYAHGIFELSFASPVPSRSSESKVGINGTIVTGSKGWLDIINGKNEESKDVVRVTIRTRLTSEKEEAEKDDGKVEEEAEVIEERVRGIEVEVASFINAIRFSSEKTVRDQWALTTPIGNPRDALKDVAVIEASLRSGGRPVDLIGLEEGRLAW